MARSDGWVARDGCHPPYLLPDKHLRLGVRLDHWDKFFKDAAMIGARACLDALQEVQTASLEPVNSYGPMVSSPPLNAMPP